MRDIRRGLFKIIMDLWEIETPQCQQPVMWMLADAHDCYRVLTCGGIHNERIGDTLQAPSWLEWEITEWLDEKRKEGNAELLLLPIRGEAWLVLTHFYLSAGCYLFVRVPNAEHPEQVPCESDGLTDVAVYPAWPSDIWLPCAGDFFRTVEHWRRVMDCIPHPAGRAREWEEMTRLMRAVAVLVGMDVVEAAAVESAEESDIADADADFGMLSVLLMLSLNAMYTCGVRTVGTYGEAMEEGTALVLTVSDCPPTFQAEKSREVLFGERLAEQRAGIFSCIQYERRLQWTFCAARKDFSLLGVKLPSRFSLLADTASE